MSPFKKQNVTTALNMTIFKYIYLIIGKIIRTHINSTVNIKLISPHFPIYTFPLRLRELQTLIPEQHLSSSPRLLKPILLKCPFFVQSALKQ